MIGDVESGRKGTMTVRDLDQEGYGDDVDLSILAVVGKAILCYANNMGVDRVLAPCSSARYDISSVALLLLISIRTIYSELGVGPSVKPG